MHIDLVMFFIEENYQFCFAHNLLSSLNMMNKEGMIQPILLLLTYIYEAASSL
jgi:hypothetical protein